MAMIDDIVSEISSPLTISKAEAVEVVGVEELGGLKAYHFLLVGRLLTVKAFHKEPLIGTMKAIWYTREEFTTVPLDGPTRFLFSFKSDFD